MNKDDTHVYAWELGLFAPSVSQLNFEDTLSLISDCGYRWVEWRVQTQEAIDSSPWGKAYNTLPLDTMKEDLKTYLPLLEKYGVKYVIYGHLHGSACKADKIIEKNGIKYFLTSCDLVDNCPQLITEI